MRFSQLAKVIFAQNPQRKSQTQIRICKATQTSNTKRKKNDKENLPRQQRHNDD
ncbi:hypothetical protein [Helicobacter macacae]|uniref:hypothetical protein n=1 Tax=Helicobacter macacae TaxID=398626 RepID=UPI000413F3A2|nr:hypothetical protein [Helicobacter macacae]